MVSFTKSMFDDIRNSLESGKKDSGNFRDILKTESGNSYVVRLVPNMKEPKRTFHHYFHHVWQNPETGQYVSGICPSTWDEPCPICTARFKLYKSGDQETAKLLKKKENWLVNVYVIEDPKNAENVGTTKIFRYGKQVQKIIDDAMAGEDAEEYGPAIFDLSKNGCSLRIKVETNEGGYPTYVSSRFLSKKAIPGMTDEKIEEIHSNIFDLDSFFEIKTHDELVDLMNNNISPTVKIDSSASSPKKEEVSQPAAKKTKKAAKVVEEPEEDDDSDLDEPVEETSTEDLSDNPDDSDDENIDDKIADLLKDL